MLTNEQIQVITHSGGHAVVQAGPGVGKSTTLRYRVKHLIEEQGVNPFSIVVLMFNKAARKSFKEGLVALLGGRIADQVQVHTFHSFAMGVIKWTERYLGFHKRAVFTDFATTRLINQSIRALVAAGEFSSQVAATINQEQVAQAIGLWKGMMLTPDRAGHHTDFRIPIVYKTYEGIRKSEFGITYDDFIPRAVALLRQIEDDRIRETFCQWSHVLVDEFQDVNYACWELIQTIRGDADVMAVGDCDQTLYEFRGARPEYMLGIEVLLDNKPVSMYRLSRSFRFGPVIAQAAANVIDHNTRRIAKNLLANKPGRHAEVAVHEGAGANRVITAEIVRSIKNLSVSPDQVAVLGRTGAQLAGLEAQFLKAKVPYRMVGREPFFERREVQVLVDYLRLSSELEHAVSTEVEQLVLNTINSPNRKIRTAAVALGLRRAIYDKTPLGRALVDLDLTMVQQQRVGKYIATLQWVGRMGGVGKTTVSAADALEFVVEQTGYLEHFKSYHGNGSESEERQRIVKSFIDYAKDLGLSVSEFLEHLDGLDNTQGAEKGQCVAMRTIHSAKGLEFPVVVIPDCDEGFSPCLRADTNPVYDLEGKVSEPELSELIEAERRLFYVAVTRGMNKVVIGCSDGTGGRLPSRFIDEMELNTTAQLMGGLQRLANRIEESDRDLLRDIKDVGGRPLIDSNLRQYLIDLGIPGATIATADWQPGRPFRYSRAYQKPQATIEVGPPPLDSAWLNVEVEF